MNRPALSGGRLRLALLLLSASLNSACQTAPESDNTVPLEEARKQKLIYRGIEAPPRTIEDVLASLQHAPAGSNEDAALARAQPPAGASDAALADFYYRRGLAAERLGLGHQMVGDFRQAVKYRNDDGQLYGELGSAEYWVGNLLSAMRARERCVELSIHKLGMRIACLSHLAELNSVTGNREKSRALLSEAERVLGKVSKPEVVQRNGIWISRAKSALLEDEGRYAETEPMRRAEVADRAREFERATPDYRHRMMRMYSHAETTLARNLFRQQNFVDAESVARKQFYRDLKLSGKSSPRVGAALTSLSTVLFEQGRNRESLQLADAAIATFERAGQSSSTFFVEARRARAAALVAEGQYNEALAEYERLKAGVAQDAILSATLGRGDPEWTIALLRTGQSAPALAMSERLLAHARERLGNNHYDVSERRGLRAMALAAAGRRDEALREFNATLTVLSRGSSQAEASDSSAARGRRLTHILEAYLALLAQRAGNAAGGVDPVSEAFRVAEIARAQGVQRAMAMSAARAAARDSGLGELVRREQDQSNRLAALHQQLGGLLAAPPAEQIPENIARLRADISRQGAEREVTLAEIENNFPAYGNLVNPKPATLGQVWTSLAANEVMLSVYVGERQTYVWAIAKDGAPGFAVVNLGARDIEKTVQTLRKALDPGVATLGAMPAFDVDEAHRLYRLLLKPVEKTFAGKNTLLVVTNGALTRLPLAVLPTEPVKLKADQKLLYESYRAVPWLARKAAIAQYPSANSFITLRTQPPGDAGRRAFAGFGDPLFNETQMAEAREQAAKVVTPAGAAMRGARLPLRNLAVARVKATSAEVAAPVVANSSALAQVPRLPDTSQEILDIARALKADEAQDVFLQLRASEGQVTRADLSSRRVLVFATHGLVPGELDGLAQPALALSSPALTGERGDGLLTMEEVLGLKLNADWVVLSACNTASGDGRGGEAISGLGRAFFYAGSRALLVTHWPVETTSARALTTELFRREAADAKLTRAEALRQAELALIDGPGHVDPQSRKSVYAYAHPLFWAPYALVGDAGR
jgi:CHAT domain-containing protein